MNKILLTVTLIATLIFSAATCAAQDVWVERNSSGTDYYVMDDTIIIQKVSSDIKTFSVHVKEVKDGRLIQVFRWKFYKYGEDWWRQNRTPNPFDSDLLFPRDEMFEFCMNQLGWSYRIKDEGDDLVRYV